MNFKVARTLLVSAAALVGCQQRGDSVPRSPTVASAQASPNDAIRTAIQAHLAHNGNLNLTSFDTEVKQVTVDGDHAEAQVEFHIKNGPGTMQLTYLLAKRDGAWSVVQSMQGGSNFSHPSLDKAQAPAANGTMGGDSDIFRVLNNFHGRVVTPTRKLPPGHAPVVASPKDAKPQTP